MRRIVALLAIAGTSAIAACLDFGAIQGDTSDAATDSSAGSDAETSRDGNLLAPDADASDATIEAGHSFCAENPGHSFCDDFDEPDADDFVGAGWTMVYTSSPATLAVTDTASSSPPASLNATTPSVDGSTGYTARLAKELPSTDPKHVHVEFDINLCDVSQVSGDLELYKFAFEGSTSLSGIALQTRKNGPYIAAPNAVNYMLKNPIVAGVWQHVAIDIVVGVFGTISVMLDHTPDPLMDDGGSINTSPTDAGALFSVVGAYNRGGDAFPCTVLFDNVVMDFQ